MKSRPSCHFRFALASALAMAAPALFAAQTIPYTNGHTDNTPYSTSGANNPTTLTIASGSATQSGAITGNGTLIKDGAGSLTLSSNANSLSGATTVSGGTLQFSGVSGGLPSSAVTVESGATLAVADFGSATVGSLAGAGALSFSSSSLSVGGNNASTTFSGSLGGSGTLYKTGSGTFTFTGTASGSPSLRTTGGATIFAPSASATYSGGVEASSSGTVIVAPTDPSKFAGAISAQNGGSVTIALPNATPLGSATLFMNSGTFLTLDGFATTALSRTNVTFSSGTTATLPSGTVFGGLTAGGNTLKFNVAGRPEITVGAKDLNSVLGGAFTVQNPSGSTSLRIVKVGAGTVTYGSSLGVTVEVQAGWAVTNSGGIGLSGGGVRYLVDQTATGTLYVMTNGTIDTRSRNVVYSGSIDSNSGTTLTKIGSGSLAFTGTNNFVGTLAINGGTISVSASEKLGYDFPQFGVVSRLAFGGGTLRTTGSFTSTHPVTLNAGGGTFDVASGTTLTWNSVIAGASGYTLTKTGAGTLILGGTNTYAGATTVTAGRVAVNGSAANSAFTVSGGILSGTGTVGTLVIASGGTIAPGNSVGTLNAGATTWAGGGYFNFEVSSRTGAAGTGFDLLAITGSLTLGATAGNRFTIDVDTIDFATGLAGLPQNFTPGGNYTFAFVTTTGGIIDFDADAFAFDLTGVDPSLTGVWSIGHSGNNLNLIYTGGGGGAAPVPEPATWGALLGTGALFFAGWRKRSKRGPAG